MMKMKRFVAMVLVLVFVLSFAATASAAEITWESGNARYSAVAEQMSQGSDIARFTSTTMYHHWNPNNMATVIRANTDCTVRVSISWEGESRYSHIVEQAVVQEGLRLSTTFSLPAGYSVSIPGDAETGEYMIGVHYYTADGYWKVYDITNESTCVLDEGEFYNAPRNTACSFGYYKVD